MARATNKLSDSAIRAAKPGPRTIKLADGEGLRLEVTPSGHKRWRWKFRWNGRERLLSLGAYPTVSLAEARAQRHELRKLLARGEDPSAARQAARAAESGTDTFQAVAEEWLAKQTHLAQDTRTLTQRRWERWVFPEIGEKPIDAVEPADVLKALRKIEASGRYETCRRMRQRTSEVFRYAVASGLATRDPAHDVKGALSPVPTKNRAAITDPTRLGELLRSIDHYGGEPTVRTALQMLAYCFTRPGELRLSEWSEFDLQTGIWRVPAQRMKMRREHVVPLAPQAVDLLQALQPLTGDRYVFESPRRGRAISENAMSVALKAMGYSGDTHSPHGFRSTASTLLHELGWPPEVIELQLAHAQRSQVAAAYNRSARLEERRKMMQAWADYLGQIKADAVVIPLQHQQAT